MSRPDGAALRRRATRVVTSDDSAERWGNTGLAVLSTPAILGATEQLCAEAMRELLAPGEMSVGVDVTMRHRAPSPVGGTVEYLVAADRVGRQTEFTFEVRDERGTLLCAGTHSRAVVDVDRFRRRLEPAPEGGPA
ncbi:thioesterase family protein [Micromonospora echinospora]